MTPAGHRSPAEREAYRLSAGVAVVRRGPADWVFLMLRAYRNWDFPKGIVEAGEDPLAAACREVREETLIDDLAFNWGEVYRETGPYAHRKIARYYLAETRTQSVALPVSPQLGRPEHDEWRWVDRAAALGLASTRVRPIVRWAAAGLAPASGAASGVGSRPPRMQADSGAPVAQATVTDDFGRPVTVRYPPERIVSLAPGATAMLLAAGAGSQLVATIQYSGQPASERNLPKIGTVGAIDMERLIAARPDVVIVWPNGNSPAEIATIERLGIPVYRQEADTLRGIGASLRRLGRLAGTSGVADREASRLEAKLASLRAQYANVKPPPTALLEVWNRPLYTVGGRELMSDALRVCGVRNVFADLPQRAPAVGIGAVIARDPDMIIAIAPAGRGASWLAAWRRFPFLRAVRNGRMLAFGDQRLSGLGPGIIDATAELCRRIAALRPRPRAHEDGRPAGLELRHDRTVGPLR